MFIIVILLICINVIITLQIKHKNIGFPVYVMCLSFICAICALVLYLVKSGYHVSVLSRYFYLPQSLIQRMISLPLRRINIIQMLNVGCILFVYISLTFSIKLYFSRVNRWLYLILFIPSMMQLVLVDPETYRWLYARLFAAIQDATQITRIRECVQRAIKYISWMYCLLAIGFNVATYVQAYKYRHIRNIMAAICLGFIAMVGAFLVIFPDMPMFLYNYSVTTNYSSYQIFILDKHPIVYSAVPVLMGLCMGVVTIALMRYNRLSNQMSNAEFLLTRDINSAALVARTFCHYTKNEILAIQAEIDTALENATSESLSTALTQIHQRCEGIYAHMAHASYNMDHARLFLKRVNLLSYMETHVLAFSRSYPDVDFSMRTECAPMVMLDSVYFQQVLHHLVMNAVESMERKGGDERSIFFHIEQAHQWAILSILDNGEGIPKSELNKVFLPYYSTKPERKNWGLGLSLCHSIIRLHDGHIYVESIEHKQTLFTIYLPIAR